MKTTRRKLFIVIILILLFQKLSASDLFIKCKYSNIPIKAAGTYICNENGNIKYRTPSGDEINLLATPDFLSEDKYKINKKAVYIAGNDLYGKNFYDFDGKGNFYFFGTISYFIFKTPDSYIDYETINDTLVVYKFNPETLAITYKLLNDNSVANELCVSKDGKYIFIDCIENFEKWENTGSTALYLISTDFKSEPKKIFSLNLIEKVPERTLRAICFDNNTRNFYYSLAKTSNNPTYYGLFEIKPDFDGNFSNENIFFEKLQYEPPSKLYSNQDGLWGVVKNDNDSLTSSLVYIKDYKGKTVKNQPASISKFQISGNWLYNPGILVDDDFILSITDNKSKVMKITTNSIEDVSNYLSKSSYDKNDLIRFRDLIRNEKENEENNSVSKKLLFLCIYIISALLIIIILLILWICHLTSKRNQLRKDKKFIFSIQEAERGKISRDIHDSIIQDIRSIRLKTELLKINEESEETKKDVLKLATDCVVKLRNICYNLTPAELATHVDGDNSQIELVSIIQSLVLQFIERTHVPCRVKVDENFNYPVLDKETSQNLFRIVQEALTNIEKHSYATDCQIWIRNRDMKEKKGMYIFISDDGIGCDIKSTLRRHSKFHFGLQNIIDRANLIGAIVEFQSEPGHGFEVSIQI